MSTVVKPMDGWKTIRWRKVERRVFKLQKRLDQASRRGEAGRMHGLQRLLVNSRSGKLLAVRRVTPDNRGKKTAGIDGVKSLTPRERLLLAEHLSLDDQAKPVRRVWIPKTNSEELRPLGIPVLGDRARQSLVKAALEPEWEARVEPHSYGFRPGRRAHEAIKAMHGGISQKPKWVLDADLAKCFDRIAQAALLAKLNTNPKLRRVIKGWLEAGVMDGEELFPTTAGTPQGGVMSPLLAHLALHGRETIINEKFPPRRDCRSPKVVRDADDFVILHEEREVIERCLEIVKQWLGEMGLELNESKTRITQTVEMTEGEAGCGFLGVRIRKDPAGKDNSDRNGHGQAVGCLTRTEPRQQGIKRHTEKLRETVKRHLAKKESELIEALNPQLAGWSNYDKYVVGHIAFSQLGTVLCAMLYAWAKRRHPKQSQGWIVRQDWHVTGGWKFQAPNGGAQLRRHDQTHDECSVKVAGARSP